MGNHILYRDNVTTDKRTDYLRAAGKTIARIVNDTRITYPHQNHLGSPVTATSSTGEILWRESYTPYGEKRINPSDNRDDEGFTGHIEDSASGLTYMQARYYDPVVGRFYSNDPVDVLGHARLEGEIGYVHGFNRYSYVGNNPYKYTDPTGEHRRRALKNIGKSIEKTETAKKFNKWVDKKVGEIFKSRKDAMTQAKKDAGVPRSQQPEKVDKVKMTNSNNNTVKNKDGSVVKTTEYTHTTTDGKKVVIQDHSAGHKNYGGDATKPHLNVRPSENTRTGKVQGTKEHYVFDN